MIPMNLTERVRLLSIRVAQQFVTLTNRIAAVDAKAVDIATVDARIENSVRVAPAALEALSQLSEALAENSDMDAALALQLASKANSGDVLALNDRVTQNVDRLDQKIAGFEMAVAAEQGGLKTFALGLNDRITQNVDRIDGKIASLEQFIQAQSGEDLDYVAIFEANLVP